MEPVELTSFETPVLLLIFNRPETTRQILNRIREIRPSQLYIAADGPRENNQTDQVNCELTRKLINDIDWPVQVHTLFRNENLGCAIGVSGAITWFFEHVEAGIILEDDCLPDLSFFTFCEELLKRYADNPKIMHISGFNMVSIPSYHSSYYFSKFEHVWGWATWKRAWELHDLYLNAYNDQTKLLVTNSYKKYMLDRMKSGKFFSTWDYQWHFTLMLNNGVCVTPNVSLIRNIGFGAGSTHTLMTPGWLKNVSYGTINQIIHPQNLQIMPSLEADEYISKQFRHNPIKEFVKRLIGRG